HFRPCSTSQCTRSAHAVATFTRLNKSTLRGWFSIEQVALVTGHKDWKMLRRYTHNAHSTGVCRRLPAAVSRDDRRGQGGDRLIRKGPRGKAGSLGPVFLPHSKTVPETWLLC